MGKVFSACPSSRGVSMGAPQVKRAGVWQTFFGRVDVRAVRLDLRAQLHAAQLHALDRSRRPCARPSRGDDSCRWVTIAGDDCTGGKGDDSGGGG